MKVTVKGTETHTFCKAGAAVSDREVPDTVINIHIPIELLERQIGTSPGWEKKWREFYANEGLKLAKLLRERLPGGTFNALLVAMLDRTRCILNIPFPPPPENRVETVQEAFDLLASLVERQAVFSGSDEHPVWEKAGEFCHRLRDQGMERKLFACDYKEKDDV